MVALVTSCKRVTLWERKTVQRRHSYVASDCRNPAEKIRDKLRRPLIKKQLKCNVKKTDVSLCESMLSLCFCVISSYPARIDIFFWKNKGWLGLQLLNGNFECTVSCRLLQYANILHKIWTIHRIASRMSTYYFTTVIFIWQLHVMLIKLEHQQESAQAFFKI